MTIDTCDTPAAMSLANGSGRDRATARMRFHGPRQHHAGRRRMQRFQRHDPRSIARNAVHRRPRHQPAPTHLAGLHPWGMRSEGHAGASRGAWPRHWHVRRDWRDRRLAATCSTSPDRFIRGRARLAHPSQNLRPEFRHVEPRRQRLALPGWPRHALRHPDAAILAPGVHVRPVVASRLRAAARAAARPELCCVPRLAWTGRLLGRALHAPWCIAGARSG